MVIQTLRSVASASVDDATRRAISQVEDFLERVLASEADRWVHHPRPSGLIEDLQAAVIAPAKRMRPAFAHWGYVGASGGREPGPDGTQLGAALELLHTFALVHDDVMDGSELRRGEASVHARIAARHERYSWRGERRRFAEGSAVLVGDLAFAQAHRLIADMPTGVGHVWHLMCDELVVGQHLDLAGAAAGESSMDYADTVSCLKSGRYSVVRPLQLGAALAGALDRHGPTYTRYGEPLGTAFQLRDDLLGVLGDPADTGKPVGQDLREGKPTVLLSLIAQRAPASMSGLLERVGSPELTDDDIAALVDLSETSGSIAEVERRIAAAVSQARKALTDSGLDESARYALDALAQTVAWRDR